MQATNPSTRTVAAFPRRVCVIGLGHIGLALAAVLASRGHKVHGVDTAERAVSRALGQSDLLEPGLNDAVRSAVTEGLLTASDTPAPADVFVIAVPTPCVDGQADLGAVRAATSACAKLLLPGSLVLVESTLPVGGTERVADWIRQLRPDLRVGGEAGCHVAYSPERVLPGRVLLELETVPRVVGGIDGPSTVAGVAFYRSFVPSAVTGTRAAVAELTKLAENTFRDVNIAFANELSMICGTLGVEASEVIRLANRHPRVDILSPGPGVGGHCIAVDPHFLAHSSSHNARLVKAARLVNKEKEQWVVSRVLEAASRFRDPVIACLGLAYKANVDDTRQSPALGVVMRLTEALPRGRVLAADPLVDPPASVRVVPLQEAIEAADVVVCLVRHDCYRGLGQALATKVVIDTCGVLG